MSCKNNTNTNSDFEEFYGDYIKLYDINDVVFGSFWLALFGNYEAGKGALKYKEELINFLVDDGKFIYDNKKLIKNLEKINIDISNHLEDLGSHVYNIWSRKEVSVKTNGEIRDFLQEVMKFFTIDGKINFLEKLNIKVNDKINFKDFYSSYLLITSGYKSNKIMWFQGTFVFDWLKNIYYSNFVDESTLPELEFIIRKASKPVKTGLLGKNYIYNKKDKDNYNNFLLSEKALNYESNYYGEDKIFHIENDLCEKGKNILNK